jgi:hypothetical protein
MQVYAATIVYTAMRVAQARVAQQHRLEPEAISPQKFFVRMAVASSTLTGFQLGCETMKKLNPGRSLKTPRPEGHPFVTATLGSILVEKRNPVRRKRRPPKNLHRWLTFRHIRGGRRLLAP